MCHRCVETQGWYWVRGQFGLEQKKILIGEGCFVTRARYASGASAYALRSQPLRGKTAYEQEQNKQPKHTTPGAEFQMKRKPLCAEKN